jgi:hypothetical protein
MLRITAKGASVAGLIALMLVSSGCQSLGVKPWDRGLLAKETMAPGKADGLDDAFDDHIYFSKEGSSGGRGFGGGGCGCN